ncbi:MAG: hypothetical protein ABI617_01245 [Sphingomicrobium sp.]
MMRSKGMIDSVPADIRRFEALQLTSIVLGTLHQFAAHRNGLIDAIIGAIISLVLTLLISRKRKNWARWLLLIMSLMGATFMLWNAATVFAQGYPLLTIAVTVIQAAALFLLFTNQSSKWLRQRHSPA